MLFLVLVAFVSADWYHNTKAININAQNYPTLVGSDKSVVLDFFTPWCVYCQQMAGEYNRLYEHYTEFEATKRDDVIIAKMNCDDPGSQIICHQFGVRSFPTIIFIKAESNETHAVFQNYRRYDFFVPWVDSLLPDIGLFREQQRQREEDERVRIYAEQLQAEAEAQLSQEIIQEIQIQREQQEQIKILNDQLDEINLVVAELNTQMTQLKLSTSPSILFVCLGFFAGVVITASICIIQHK